MQLQRASVAFRLAKQENCNTVLKMILEKLKYLG